MSPDKLYLRRLRRMRPERRLLIALELSELVREIAREAIRASDRNLRRRDVENKLWERIGR